MSFLLCPLHGPLTELGAPLLAHLHRLLHDGGHLLHQLAPRRRLVEADELPNLLVGEAESGRANRTTTPATATPTIPASPGPPAGAAAPRAPRPSVSERPVPEEAVAASEPSAQEPAPAAEHASDPAALAGEPSPAAGGMEAKAARVSDVQIDDPDVEATPLGMCLVRLARAMSFAPFDGRPFRVELALNWGKAG